MTSPLHLYIDGQPNLEVARGGGVPGQLRALFARLDADMDAGIELGGVWIPTPDEPQRRAFVVQQLLGAALAGQRDFARTLLIWLALRWPTLRAIRACAGADRWDVELEQD